MGEVAAGAQPCLEGGPAAQREGWMEAANQSDSCLLSLTAAAELRLPPTPFHGESVRRDHLALEGAPNKRLWQFYALPGGGSLGVETQWV